MELTKHDIATPALIVDLPVLERNLVTMAEFARTHGKQLRPHMKTHKCVPLARRQIELGAVGLCSATVPEMEVLVTSGISNVLLTSPLTSPGKIAHVATLAERCSTLMVAVDHPKQVEMYGDAMTSGARDLGVMIDLDVGDHRTGLLPGKPALELARLVADTPGLRLRGLQAYSGSSSHVEGFAQRRNHSLKVMARAIETRDLLETNGLSVPILSGGSTGTYNIDGELEGLTELQVGSYVFMDLDYQRTGGRDGSVYEDFQPALTVLTTVVSANHRSHVTLDAGVKAFATDQPFAPQARHVQGVTYEFFGDEFGRLRLDEPDREIRLGDRLEFVVPHCDPTVNLYEQMYVCRGERVEHIWPIMNRSAAVRLEASG
jgi:D-serine deaminase-like pyridoxal phosphate-dependent protein